MTETFAAETTVASRMASAAPAIGPRHYCINSFASGYVNRPLQHAAIRSRIAQFLRNSPR